ncbi:MAG: amidohydrolase, partial [Alphaproteobacteria bacterium]
MKKFIPLIIFFVSLPLAQAFGAEVPDRAEGEGQYNRLILRGGYVIDGTGAPPFGPVDIVIEKDRITEIRNVGTPGVAIDPDGRPEKGDREIDAYGKFILPGFIDLHSHIHSLDSEQGVSPEYIFKLQLGHGITTIRSLGSGGDKRIVGFKKRSARNEITAPRIVAYPVFYGINSPKEARKRIKEIKKNGGDGV